MTNKLIPGKLYLFKKTLLHPSPDARNFVAMILVGDEGSGYEHKCLEQNGKITYRIDTWWDLTELK